MRGQEFFAVEPERLKYFDQDYPFGEEVFNRFGSANEDIYEACMCLALDRGTACVMHLSRVVEAGLKALARELRLPDRPDWGRHLEDIDRELTKRYRLSGSRTPDEQFFSEVATQIGHIKTAWRNPSMHVDRTYTLENAEKILTAVRSFMQHLTLRLHE